jgi:ABC-type hemin transport system ATPase subunit
VTALYRFQDVRVLRSGRVVLDLQALELGGDGITALVGPNGAGKSTLLEVLAFLLPHDAGEMHFAQTPVTTRVAANPEPARRARGAAPVPVRSHGARQCDAGPGTPRPDDSGRRRAGG